MTFRELLKITDSNTKVCVRIKMFGLKFETTHFPRFYYEADEAAKILDMLVEKIYTTETESVIVVTLV